MSDNNNIKSIMDVTLEKIRSMVAADTIVGDPIYMDDVKIIPVSKVGFGVATGGTDYPAKTTGKTLFGGGGGAGVSITPVAFLVVKNGDVKLMQIYNDASDIERAVAVLPEVFEKIKLLFSKKDSAENTEE